MTTIRPAPVATNPYPVRHRSRGSLAAYHLRTTDPKDVGVLYMVTAFCSRRTLPGAPQRDQHRGAGVGEPT